MIRSKWVGVLAAAVLVAALSLALFGFSSSSVLTNPIEDLPDHELTCGGAVATIVGTEGDDLLIGTDGDDVIKSFGGDDTIFGLDGNDIICSGSGDDYIHGGAGDDELRAGFGDDSLSGVRVTTNLKGGLATIISVALPATILYRGARVTTSYMAILARIFATEGLVWTRRAAKPKQISKDNDQFVRLFLVNLHEQEGGFGHPLRY